MLLKMLTCAREAGAYRPPEAGRGFGRRAEFRVPLRLVLVVLGVIDPLLCRVPLLSSAAIMRRLVARLVRRIGVHLMINRNIITPADIRRGVAAKTPAELPKTFDVNPPAGIGIPQTDEEGRPGYRGGSATATGPGGVAPASGDDYMSKLLKYVPIEVIGFYLLLAGVIDSNVTNRYDHAVWLGTLLVGTLVITALYDYQVLGVVRVTQIGVSMVGLAVYVFAAGGWFATTTWYHAWYASIAVPVFGLLVAIVRLRPLPPVGDAAGAA